MIAYAKRSADAAIWPKTQARRAQPRSSSLVLAQNDVLTPLHGKLRHTQSAHFGAISSIVIARVETRDCFAAFATAYLVIGILYAKPLPELLLLLNLEMLPSTFTFSGHRWADNAIGLGVVAIGYWVASKVMLRRAFVVEGA